MIVDRLDVSVAELERETGWSVKPQGACKDAVCVPLPSEAYVKNDRGNDAHVDMRVVAERLGMPIVHDDNGLVAIGPDTAVTGRALTTAVAPELELPDFEGNPFRLSSLRGQKVLLVAWASW